MADIVNFQDRLDKKTKYFERMDLTAKMVPVMVEAVGKMRTMGRASWRRRSARTGVAGRVPMDARITHYG